MPFDKNEWFRTWFDSPFYALLYRNRSEQEAADFIDRLTEKLDLPERSSILDLACGRGRHSIHLFNKGYRVVGIDLSNNSIAYAKQFEKEGLKFLRDDMRTFELGKRFDAVFNLFTSFGYFENISDNHEVLKNVHQHLLPGGLFVMDYFNAIKVERLMIPYEEKEIDGVSFEIRKRIENGQIIKSITIEQENRRMEFEEKVQLIAPSILENMLKSHSFEILHTFGDYFLNDYNSDLSDRFILVGRAQ
jgi:cyclopropane fatty-acyl-phospholipid synthase-like methyltransferase